MVRRGIVLYGGYGKAWFSFGMVLYVIAGMVRHGIVWHGWETAALDLTLEFVVADLLQFCEMHFLSQQTILYSMEHTAAIYHTTPI